MDIEKNSVTPSARIGNVLGSALASVYAIILVSMYIAFSFTDLITYPRFKEYLENKGFFIYLFLVSDVYFLFVIYQVRKASKDDTKMMVVENHKSHGSWSVRFGAIVFGLVTFVYLFMELLDYFEIQTSSPCFMIIKVGNILFMIIFVGLQVFIIVEYPRLNLLCNQMINRYGMLHVVATNIILWIRTLIKESLEEIFEFLEEHHMENHDDHGSLHFNKTTEEVTFLDQLKQSLDLEEACNQYRYDFLGDAIKISSPYLYPFIIEFSLIGASVAFVMSNHIGKKPDFQETRHNHMRSPDICTFFKKNDYSHSLKGILGGIVMIMVAIANLCLFFGFDLHNKVSAEHLCKIFLVVINIMAAAGIIAGFSEIKQLEYLPELKECGQVLDLDMSLLSFTSFFTVLYMIFTVIGGIFKTQVLSLINVLHVLNGCMGVAQISLQIIFIFNLKHKALPEDKEGSKPGRQITVFLFLFNLAQWIIFSFEIQKIRSSLDEADFYGFMPWIVILRTTLPMAIFFYFHSAVVSIELFKNVFDERVQLRRKSMYSDTMFS